MVGAFDEAELDQAPLEFILGQVGCAICHHDGLDPAAEAAAGAPERRTRRLFRYLTVGGHDSSFAPGCRLVFAASQTRGQVKNAIVSMP